MMSSVVRSGGGIARCCVACGAAAAAEAGWLRGSGTSAGAGRTLRPVPRTLLPHNAPVSYSGRTSSTHFYGITQYIAH